MFRKLVGKPIVSAPRRLLSTLHKVPVVGEEFTSNIPASQQAKIGKNLHQLENHPVGIIKNIIFNHFRSTYKKEDGTSAFSTFDNLPPFVTVKQNFHDLLIPDDHPSRSISDTFYLDPSTVLRPHTSAHQTELLRKGEDAFLVAGDCFRRDEIDASHYPVFHQMEGVKMFDPTTLPANEEEATALIMADLKKTLEGVAKVLFGEVEMRWIDAYFPFTHPSAELEVLFNGKWLEVLGCGKVQPKILATCDKSHLQGWAFGLGLDRLAMILFQVPDIRLFWTEDERFHNQFEAGKITLFQPFSKYPGTARDVSFWYSNEHFHDNDFFAYVREAAGDCVDSVELMDSFTHPKSGRTSKMFRINYRSLERTLTTEEVNEWQENVRQVFSKHPSIELR